MRRNLVGLFGVTGSAFLCLALLGGCQFFPVTEAQIPHPSPTSTPAITVTIANRSDQASQVAFAPEVEGPIVITEDDINRTFMYTLTSRFGIDLNPSEYPFEELDFSTCEFIGYVSNWSINGPDSYPIGFEVTKEGSCIIRNGSFQVLVEGKAGP